MDGGASDLYIGVDGGGTWTRAALSDGVGNILAEGRTASTNRNHHSDSVVIANLRGLLTDLLATRDFSRVRCIQMGMSGISTFADRSDFLGLIRTIPELGPVQRIDVENDAYIGLTGSLAGRPGLFLIAGTGSAVLGRNSYGETHWCGGWGALADDAGSAYALGLDAVRMAVRAEDGRVRPTILRDLVFDYLSIADEPRKLITRLHNSALTRNDLARLAPKVLCAYERNDWAAQEIVLHAVDALTESVRATATALFEPDERCDLALSGGLALSGPPFQELLTRHIEINCPNIRVVPAVLPAVKGALLEAITRVNGTIPDTVIQNLQKERN